MMLIAIVLGASSAWLVDKTWNWFLGERPTDEKLLPSFDERKHRWQFRRSRASYWLVLILTLVLAIIFGFGIYGRYKGYWEWDFVVWQYYLTLPSTLGGIIAFALGAISVPLRRYLKELLVRIYNSLTAPPLALAASNAAAGGNPPPAAPIATPAEKSSAPYSWLTAIVGIAAVTLVAVITLVVFFPETLSRVESIKVAGVEARFATSANRSVRTGIGAGIDSRQNRDELLKRWVNYENAKNYFIDPAQRVFNAGVKLSQERRDAAHKIWTGGDFFYKHIAKPLSVVFACYSGDFNISETEAQHGVTKIANEWGRIFKAGTTEGLQTAFLETYELVHRLDKDLARHDSICGDKTRKPWTRQFPKFDCESDCRDKGEFTDEFKKEYASTIDELGKKANDFTRNGYMMGFVAHLYMMAYKPAEVVEIMEAMGARLDGDFGTQLAKYYFYTVRAEAKFLAREPANEQNADLTEARKIVTDLIRFIEDKKKTKDTDKPSAGKSAAPASDAGRNRGANRDKESGVDEYTDLTLLTDRFTMDRVNINNNLLYNLIMDWLEGRRLLPEEIRTLEGLPEGGLAYEMSEWIRKQSLTALDDLAKRTDQKGTGIINVSLAESATYLVGQFYDTLAMREIALGAIKNDLSRDRCARILAYLAEARKIFKKDKQTLLILAAHHNMYENACAS